jgi:hypothetical protein
MTILISEASFRSASCIAGIGWRLPKLGVMPCSDDVGEINSQVAAQVSAVGAWACLFKPFDQGELTSGAVLIRRGGVGMVHKYGRRAHNKTEPRATPRETH